MKGHTDCIFYIDFDYQNKLLASCSKDFTIKLWSTKDFTEVATLESHSNDVTCVAFDPFKSRLASCSADQTVKIWNTKTLKVI